MKHTLLFLGTFLFTNFTLTGQNQEEVAPVLSDSFAIGADFQYPTERIVYEMFDIQKPPAFPGGEKELLKFLAENLKLPPNYADSYSNFTSTALTFIIDTDGSISEKKVLRNNGPLAQSALKMLDQMPCWSPGMKDGQPVPVKFTLPVRVKLE